MVSKLKSRKLWAAVAAGALNILGGQLGLDPALTLKLSGIIAVYILGQGLADSGKASTSQH